MPSGWAVLGDTQILPGYSLLLPDLVVPDLNAPAFDSQRDQPLITRLAQALQRRMA